MKNKIEISSLIAGLIGIVVANAYLKTINTALLIPFFISFISYHIFNKFKYISAPYQYASSIQIGLLSFTALIIISKNLPVYDLYIFLLLLIWFVSINDTISSFFLLIYNAILIIQTSLTIDINASVQAQSISYTLIIARLMSVIYISLQIKNIIASNKEIQYQNPIQKIYHVIFNNGKHIISLSFINTALIFSSMNFDGYFFDSELYDHRIAIIIPLVFLCSYFGYLILSKLIQSCCEGVKRLSYILFIIGLICGVLFFYDIVNIGFFEDVFSMVIISSILFAVSFPLMFITFFKSSKWVVDGFKKQ